ncbi:hypothetical protein BD626DRAFT_587918 [Schizophyllum amplum]|uniref:Uncharacterized protein n=1 Tax=Schizophyllum amplum TaxID=97359 RepID=A0A550BT23_9AGAR|nr:hypothetical protein BD626DRAFT_587918 [Auriculariopsis ampla]
MTFECYLYEDGIAEARIEGTSGADDDHPSKAAPEEQVHRTHRRRPFYARKKSYALSSDNIPRLPPGRAPRKKAQGYGALHPFLEAMKSMPNLSSSNDTAPPATSSSRDSEDAGRQPTTKLRFYYERPGYAAKAEKILDVYGIYDRNPMKFKIKRSLSDRVINVLKRTASKGHRRVRSEEIPKQGWD